MASNDIVTEGQVDDLVAALSGDLKWLTNFGVYGWKTGDSDPTVGGTVTLPAGIWIIVLDNGASAPSWTPTGAVVIEAAA
jgi:hypothetical protein